ncbi:MAG: phosphatidylserine decarboxylase [Thermoplasmatota archaeon]
MLAKGSLKPITISSILVFFTIVIGYYMWYPIFYFTILFLILALALVIFFRDPDRTIGKGLVSPADGNVILVDKEINRIDVFMNITNVHVNRSPYSGKIKDAKWIHGEFNLAFSEKSENNFKHVITLVTDYGTIKIHQITGFFARRIVPYIDKGDELQKGERIGLIRFGSRVRLDLPDNLDITAEKGDKVRAGESTIGVWDED